MSRRQKWCQNVILTSFTKVVKCSTTNKPGHPHRSFHWFCHRWPHPLLLEIQFWKIIETKHKKPANWLSTKTKFSPYPFWSVFTVPIGKHGTLRYSALTSAILMSFLCQLNDNVTWHPIQPMCWTTCGDFLFLSYPRSDDQGQIIRIFNGCEVLIENSVTRVTVRHQCRVMPNSYPSDGIFIWTIMDSFSCIFFLRQLHLDLNVLFYPFYAKITKCFDQEKFGTAPLLNVDVKIFGGNWRENDVKTSKMTSNSSYWRHARELSYTPHVIRYFLVPVGFTENLVGYARKEFVTQAKASDFLIWCARKF